MRCGVFADHALRNGLAEYFYEPTREECKELHDRGMIRIGKTLLTGLLRNATTSRTATLAGIMNNDGGCTGEDFSYNFGAWDKAIATASVRITLTDYLARTSLKADRVILHNGFVCSSKREFCALNTGAYAFWDRLPEYECSGEQFHVLHSGPALKTIDKSEHKMATIYSVVRNEMTFAVTMTGSKLMCGWEFYTTEHPRLIVLEKAKGRFLTQEFVKTKEVDIMMYVNSKIIYVEKHINKQMTDLYYDVLHKQCEIEKKVLKNSQILATLRPDEFAYNLMNGPGYYAVLSGEILQVFKCTPLVVRLLETENCYQEIVVEANNITYFLTPKTRILKTRGIQINCNTLTPTTFEIDGIWYRFSPRPVEVPAPGKLSPDLKPSWKYENPKGITSGLYTQKELDQFREDSMLPMNIGGVVSTITRSILGTKIKGSDISLKNLLDAASLTKIMNSLWDSMWNKFSSFGTFSAGFLGLYFIIKITKLFLDTAFHLIALHKVFGWSFFLLTAIWDNLANLILHICSPKVYQEAQTEEDTSLQEVVSTAPKKEREVDTPPTQPTSLYPVAQLSTAQQGFGLQ